MAPQRSGQAAEWLLPAVTQARRNRLNFAQSESIAFIAANAPCL